MNEAFPPADPTVPEAIDLAAALRTRMRQVRPTFGHGYVGDGDGRLTRYRRPMMTTARPLTSAQLAWLAEYAKAEKQAVREMRRDEREARRRRMRGEE